jgi:hypothetical protein
MRDRWREWRSERRRSARARTGLRRACPCCGYLTLEGDPGDYDVCKVCFWEDDPVQLRDPTYEGGANTVSLEQARINYRRHGAAELRFKDAVRPPLPGELPET